MASGNQALYLDAVGKPLRLDSAPSPQPGPSELVIRNHAVGINPVDWKMQDFGIFISSWPDVFGCDLAGEVVEVGSEAEGFHVGQRVLAHALRLGNKKVSHGAFQNLVLAEAQAVTPLPDNISYAAASALPLSLSTAAHGLYADGYLGLPLPMNSPKDTGKTILVWGGSGSVGAAAIQLAVASGLNVLSTSSRRNFDYVKSLGASKVFDYKDANVADDLIGALKGTDLVGAYDGTGSKESARLVTDIISQLGGGKIASALETAEAPYTVAKMVCAPVVHAPSHAYIGKAVFHDFLISALKTGQFKPAPPAKVVGSGLESIQRGMDELKKGVSATKIVVTL